MIRAVVIAAIALASARAWAYPQYQLSKDETCASCHLSPAGGGLLSENGLAQAETLSQWGTAPEFLNGAIGTPSWLVLGGDIRGAAGYAQREPTGALVYFPMQADLYAAAYAHQLSLHVTAGLQDPAIADGPCPGPPNYCGYKWPTLFGSREHYAMWQQREGETTGLFVRAGRFMPVYGLRFAEHPAYDRQYGGTPLYGEAYALAVEYIRPVWEVHATAFAHDPLQATTELGDGAAAYAEVRVTDKTSVGVETKVDVTTDDRKEYGGATGKHYFEDLGLLVQGEAEFVHQKVVAGGTANGVVGYALGTYFVGAVMIDLGLGVYDPNIKYRYLDQEAADLNVHWFATSHIELLLTNRFQMLELGAGGLSSGYSLLQVHYRL